MRTIKPNEQLIAELLAMMSEDLEQGFPISHIAKRLKASPNRIETLIQYDSRFFWKNIGIVGDRFYLHPHVVNGSIGYKPVEFHESEDLAFCDDSLKGYLKPGDVVGFKSEPENVKDKNAVRVLTLDSRRQLGYLRKEMAAYLQRRKSEGAKICGFYQGAEKEPYWDRQWTYCVVVCVGRKDVSRTEVESAVHARRQEKPRIDNRRFGI